MMHRPPAGVFRRLWFVVRRLCCRHKHVFFWYPASTLTFEQVKDGWKADRGYVTVIGCHNCGEIWVEG